MDFTQATPSSSTQIQGLNALSQTQNPAVLGLSSIPSNPVYHAFEDFEREARQKKFMIAECEDEIANLKKERVEVSQQNKDLGAECEKLKMEALAAEMKYEKMQKDKTLLLSQYEAVSNEMNELSQTLARKRAQKQKLQLAHEERMKVIAKRGEEFMAGLRRIPSIAKVLDKRETNGRLKGEVEQEEESLKELEKKFSELDVRYPEEWGTFVKKCVKMAEIRRELKTKLKDRDQLKAVIKEREAKVLVRKVGVGNYLKLGLGEPRSFGSNLPSSSLAGTMAAPSITRASSLFRGTRVTGMIPPIQRSPTFKAMDRILKPTNFVQLKKSSSDKPYQHSLIGARLRSGAIQPRKRMAESSLLDQLRSQIKGTGTIAVNPMPIRALSDGKQGRIAASQQQRTEGIEMASPATQEPLHAPPPPAPLAPESGKGNPKEVINTTESGPVFASVPVNSLNDPLQLAEDEPPVSTRPAASTQALMDKTMAMSSQNRAPMEKKMEHIPNPPHLPFAPPPTQSPDCFSSSSAFGFDAGPTETSLGNGLFGGLFTSPPPPASTGGAAASASDQSSFFW